MSGRPRDWTEGPAKLFAVGVLSLVGIGGLAYSIWQDVPARSASPAAASVPIKGAVGVGGDEPSGEEAPAEAPASGFAQRINVNSASAAELDLLPGIGPARAAAIVESRRVDGPFRSTKDLERVAGIGPKTAEKLGAYVTFE